MVKIFIGNLSSDTDPSDIRPLFERYGEVAECDVLKNYGFVHMTNDEEANQAISELTGTLVKGSRMRVEKSTGSSKQGGGRGGGGAAAGAGGKMRGGGRGRGRDSGGRGRGAGSNQRERYPPPPGYHPYYRSPYDYYDRYYPPSRAGERLPPLDDLYPPPYAEDRRPLPHPDDRLRERYPPPRYPPHPLDRYDDCREYYDRYERGRLPSPSEDPYYAERSLHRPPPDYYRRSPPPADRAPLGGPLGLGRETSNGYDYDVADYRDRMLTAAQGNAAQKSSYSTMYSSYYDRFYNKPSNATSQDGSIGGTGAGINRSLGGALGNPQLGTLRPGGIGSGTMSSQLKQMKVDQGFSNQGPIFF